MSRSLHARLREEALRTGQSLNQLCVSRLQASGQQPACDGANPQSGLFSREFLDRIALRWSDGLVALIHFGSSARGDATDDSDVDLLLVMLPRVKIARSLYRSWDEFCLEEGAEGDSGRISPHFVNLPGSVMEAGGLWYEVALDGIVLWERDRLASRFLGSVREAMVRGDVRRRMLHGSPYWVKGFGERDA